MSEQTQAFLDDILAVYRKHNLALAHDCGAFDVVPLAERHIDELFLCTYDETSYPVYGPFQETP